MGVHGLWRLLDASGKPVPLETLEGKVLAIDVSIWIHQVLQGYQDRKGSAIPNAHLLGLFHRICKLLYFKIKPIFVFDGGVPMLKKNTIASRKKQKAIAATKAEQMKHDLIQNLIKHAAVKGVLALGNGDKQTNSSQGSSISKSSDSAPDMFKLPSIPSQNESFSDDQLDDNEDYDSETSVELSPRKQSRWKGNIHNVDVTSDDFKALPADVRYDVLTDLKETRKQNSWGRLHEMPEVSHEFSSFQMQRLLKRRRVQESLESAEKEMGGKTLTLEELERIMSEQGIETGREDKTFRIAADSRTRLIYINDPAKMKKNSESEETVEGSSSQMSESNDPKFSVNSENNVVENEEMKESFIADINEYDLDSDWESDDESWISKKVVQPSPNLPKKYFGKRSINPALAYMLEHVGLPQEQIFALIEDQKKFSVKVEKELKEENKTPAKKSAVFHNPEKKPKETEETKVKTSESDIDKAIIGIPEICDIKTVDLTSDVEKMKNSPLEVAGTSKTLISDSDTDSDLVEIPDVPIPEKGNSLEILVKSDEIPNDDLFADVFNSNSQEVSEVSSHDTSNTHEEVSILNDSKIIEEISTQETKVTTPLVKSAEPNSSEEKFIEAKPDKSDVDESKIDETGVSKPVIDPPVAESMDVQSIPSTSGTQESTDQIAKFKPELLQANHDKLVSMQVELESEHNDLAGNIGKLERQATAVTDQMRMEAQDLLRLFGIPYVVAPMEAEAQCAYLESIDLTDGTVTDDSDIWLFGGRCVYKNFFNNNKRVMQYKSSDIEHHFKLSRQQMIQLALLVGSDYTVGVPGIGPVTALEILAAFPTEGDDLLRGLANFCTWLKTGRSVGPRRATLRNKLRNVEIEKGFPSQAVVQAYLFPTVDESKEKFTWSKPNLTLLADYTRQKFGWTKLKFEETIGPVVKKLTEVKSQLGIGSYFKVDTVPKSIETTMSKRVQKAVRRLANVDEVEEDFQEPETSTRTKEKKPRRKRAKKSEDADDSKNSTAASANDEVTQNVNEAKDKTKITRIPNGANVDEFIPQREKDRAIAQKKKLRAIEVFKKSKKTSGRTKKQRRSTTVVTKEANLSESSDSS
ncbi:DNA excision repair protein ERCC-5 homolog isoform X2 [Venturia canescens]|uniref:DNA excision repair protein ERCC-5 homolog isoform X2 n=1 Tax=Venturia canescens TaxID=32260 RepID=UPI001C9C53E8|nr:DNA excision repair protein ERCC-5 homolog isoform X2 [Venturia canescens]